MYQPQQPALQEFNHSLFSIADHRSSVSWCQWRIKVIGAGGATPPPACIGVSPFAPRRYSLCESSFISCWRRALPFYSTMQQDMICVAMVLHCTAEHNKHLRHLWLFATCGGVATINICLPIHKLCFGHGGSAGGAFTRLKDSSNIESSFQQAYHHCTSCGVNSARASTDPAIDQMSYPRWYKSE